MEFLLGFIAAFATIYFVKTFLFTDNFIKQNSVGRIIFRQSYIHSLIGFDTYYYGFEKQTTQAFEFENKHKLRTVIYEDKAYWIKDNKFLVASIVDGNIDETTTKVVDTMHLDKVELEKMIFIVKKLTEGIENDGRSTGV